MTAAWLKCSELTDVELIGKGAASHGAEGFSAATTAKYGPGSK